ncbi:MAG: PASTA domain-containing protein [Clostridiales bacterium]|nr:PASTA domain-containing protein [Clostridiales bacterium]
MYYNTGNLCIGCMQPLGDSSTCLNCHTERSYVQPSPYLPLRTVIDNKYLVGKVQDYNGDGVTYIGLDLEKNNRIFIREFFPQGAAFRSTNNINLMPMSGKEMVFEDCHQSFLALWRQIARLRGLSAIQSVYDIVDANGTSYIISDYIDGITLRDYLLRSSIGYITWKQARTLFLPVLSTLGTLHSAGIIHRGISPSTILVNQDDGKLILSGFSIWQARSMQGPLTTEIFSGYAPIEQYAGTDAKQGPWTDIYSFAAVLYRALIGSTPIDAPSRVENDTLMIPAKFAEQLPAYVINSLINALQISPEDRTRTVEELRAELSASPTAVAASASSYFDETPPSPAPTAPVREPVRGKPDKSKTSVVVLTVIIVLLALAAIGIILALTVFRDRLGLTTEPNNTVIETTTSTESTAPSGMVIVPNFVDMTKSSVEASQDIKKNFVIEWKEEHSDVVPKDFIIAQSIAANTQVAIGTKIVLTVSLGVSTVKIPDVTNLPFEQAKTILEDLGLVCVRDVKVNDGSKIGGTVAETIPGINTEVKIGDEVIVVVWQELETKPVTVTVPLFINESVNSIITNPEWKDVFKFNFVYEYNSSVPKDFVISQSLPSGSEVTAPAEITLKISLGSSD